MSKPIKRVKKNPYAGWTMEELTEELAIVIPKIKKNMARAKKERKPK